jgi:hypothetical protein
MTGSTVEVFNLSDPGQRQVFTCSPEEAVIAAYAQSRGNFNTWTYGQYRSLLRYGRISVACGDFVANKSASCGTTAKS